MTGKKLEEGRVYWRTRVRDTTRLLAFDPRSVRTISIRHSFAIVSLLLETLFALSLTAQFQLEKDSSFRFSFFNLRVFRIFEEYYRYNIVYIGNILFGNLLSKNGSPLSLFPIN